jgi:hypothetical protein
MAHDNPPSLPLDPHSCDKALALQAQQALLVSGLDQLMDQSGGRDEADR